MFYKDQKQMFRMFQVRLFSPTGLEIAKALGKTKCYAYFIVRMCHHLIIRHQTVWHSPSSWIEVSKVPVAKCKNNLESFSLPAELFAIILIALVMIEIGETRRRNRGRRNRFRTCAALDQVYCNCFCKNDVGRTTGFCTRYISYRSIGKLKIRKWKIVKCWLFPKNF